MAVLKNLEREQAPSLDRLSRGDLELGSELPLRTD